MSKLCLTTLIIISILATSIIIQPASAAPDNTKVKNNAELCAERLMELQTKNTVHIEKAAAKTENEKNLFKHEITDLNEELLISASLDSSSLVCGKTATGEIKIKDLGKDHKLRDIRIKASDLTGLPGVDKGIVKITHFNDAGLPDAVWVQEIVNNGGYVYIEGIPFSEVIIGGFIGTYEKSGTVTYQTSQTFSLGSTFDAEDVNYLTATVTPVYEEDSPYDIPTDGLVGWWRFDEASGTNVSDSSGNGNHATATGMNWTDGKYNSAGSFDGVDDFLTLPGIDFSTNDFSIVLTLNFSSTSVLNTAFSTVSGGISTTQGMSIGMSGLVPKLNINDGTFKSYSISSGLLPNGHTYQISYIMDRDGDMVVYVDGTYYGSVDISASGGNITTSASYIGKYSPSYMAGSIDNVMIYNRTLPEAEIKQIYYDSLNDLKLKTNSNTGYSDEIDESGTVSIPYDSEDSDITSLTAYVPETVTIGGVTVRDYSNTVTPFEVSATVGYTEDTTLIEETLTEDLYEIYIQYVPGNDYTTGTVTYTAAANPVLSSSLLDYDLSTNDAGASLAYNAGTRTFTITSTFVKDQTYNYKITCTKTGTVIPYMPAIDGFGNPSIEVYEATADETFLIGALYSSVPRNSTGIWGSWASSLALLTLGPMLLISVLIISYIRRV